MAGFMGCGHCPWTFPFKQFSRWLVTVTTSTLKKLLITITLELGSGSRLSLELGLARFYIQVAANFPHLGSSISRAGDTDVDTPARLVIWQHRSISDSVRHGRPIASTQALRYNCTVNQQQSTQHASEELKFQTCWLFSTVDAYVLMHHIGHLMARPHHITSWWRRPWRKT